MKINVYLNPNLKISSRFAPNTQIAIIALSAKSASGKLQDALKNPKK
jgi:hypothetical protein